MTRDVRIPLRLASEANARGHWRAKARRTKSLRAIVCAHWLRDNLPLGRKPVEVLLVRQAPRKLDGDNLQGAFKSIRDEVAHLCGFDDRAPDVLWSYEQEPSREYGIRIAVRWSES